MATLTITIPDADVARMQDAVCASYGYDPATGLTKAQFTKLFVTNTLKRVVKSYEANIAASSAASQVNAGPDVDIT